MWREFVTSEVFVAADLPGALTDRDAFVYFTEHGYVDAAPGFSVDALDDQQRAALRQLVLRYVELFQENESPDLYLTWVGLT
jgi:hypothetical protein